MLLTSPTPVTEQVSWERKRTHEFFLSVLAKRTYALDSRGHLRPAEQQEPFQVMSGDPARDGVLEHDTDGWAFKPLTDVVVQGHAYPPTPGQRSFIAKVQVASILKPLLVTGDRKAALSATGRIVLSPPAAFEKLPLSYARAYGGIDRVAEATHGNPMMVLDKYRRPELQPEYHSPFIYPRNPAGRGYLMEATPQALDALELPNIEDPYDPIEKRPLAVGSVLAWPSLPLPWGTDWLHPSAFPRSAYLGAIRQHDPPADGWPEVRRGFAENELPRIGDVGEVFDERWYNGGSLGLQFPPLGGDLSSIEIGLVGLHPSGRDVRFRLPERPPRLWVDGRNGTLVATKPVLHHVVIRPDDDRVILLWRGHALARRPYMPEELDKMPYRVEWGD
jgi:hypothetical protein